MKRTNIHLTDTVRERLQAMAAKGEKTVAALVRRAIEEFLKRNKG